MEAWVDGIEIDANSIKEAKEKLGKMTLNEIAEECDDRYYNAAVVRDIAVTDVDAEVVEATYKIRAYNINYDISDQDVVETVERDNPNIDPNSDEFEELVEKTIKETEARLPKELIVTVNCAPGDLETELADEVSEETGWLIYGCDYDILEEK